MYWPAELYSFGRCYREWLKLPFWAPLPIYGDHGISISGCLAKHEAEAKPKVFLTWDKKRADLLQASTTKKVLHIQHPWVTFRKEKKLTRKPNAKGTLVFYAHSNDGIEIKNYDWEKYFDELGKLPKQYHPLVLCMHRHDIKKGYHQRIRKFGLPIVSAGESTSPYFVERFYDIATSFRFATSNYGGSELFYCEEVGVPYFLMGDPPEKYNLEHDQLPKGLMVPRDDHAKFLEETKRDLFGQFPPEGSAEKAQFLVNTLGLNIDNEQAGLRLKKRLAVEYCRHFPAVLLNILITLIRAYTPLKVIHIVRKYLRNEG
jgi:hypothetical protein